LANAERLSQDPTFRLIGSQKIWDRGAALPSRLHWFETEVLTQDENLEGLGRINRELLAKAEVMDLRQRVVLDMDSTEIPVYGIVAAGPGAATECSFPRRSSIMFSPMSALNPRRSSNSRTKSKPPAEVTREPWKSTFKEGLNES
jgi:hypothetical protein